MTVSQWYQYLLEEGVTMVEDQEGRRTARACRVEELQPEVDWRSSFSLARLKGISLDQKSLLFKLLHQLLPTGERVHRLQPAKSLACSNCRAGEVENMQHAIFLCEANKLAAAAMLRSAQCYSASLTADRLLHLDVEVLDPFTLPTVTIVATGLELIWRNRMKTTATSYDRGGHAGGAAGQGGAAQADTEQEAP